MTDSQKKALEEFQLRLGHEVDRMEREHQIHITDLVLDRKIQHPSKPYYTEVIATTEVVA